MRSIFLAAVVVMVCTLESNARQLNQDLQDSTAIPEVAKNSVYLEVLGTLIVYSINYERKVGPVSVRVGIEPLHGPAIPILVNYYVRKDRIELGAGAIVLPKRKFPYASFQPEKRSLLWTAGIGYRHQPDDGGIIFRVTFVALFAKTAVGSGGTLLPVPAPGPAGTLPFRPWFGVSIGYAF